MTQYYSGASSAALSKPVQVSEGAVTGSIDAEMTEPGGAGEPGGGGAPSGGDPQPAAGTGSPPSTTAPPATPPSGKPPTRIKCRKGFKKKNGRPRCVKVRKHQKGH